jgi:outer membrane protein assembly factor BamA
MPWIIPYVAFRYTEQNGWSIGPAVSAVNVFGRAFYLSGRFLVGGTTTFEADFRWPALTESARLDGRVAHLTRRDDLNGFEEASDELLPWLTVSPTERTRVAGAAGFFFMTPDEDGFTLSGGKTDRLLNLGVRVAWDSRDSFRYPTRGWYHELEILRSGGDADTWRTTLDLRRHERLAHQHFLKLGALTTLQSGELGIDVPVYNRFFLGGANSIRGYDIDQLGPVLNGKNQMLLVAEYEWEFLPARAIPVLKWSFALGARLAVFGDAGIAWNGNDEFRSTRFKEGGGIGLRLLVPGSNVIRLDLGVGEEGKAYFHFSNWPRLDRQRDRLR